MNCTLNFVLCSLNLIKVWLILVVLHYHKWIIGIFGVLLNELVCDQRTAFQQVIEEHLWWALIMKLGFNTVILYPILLDHRNKVAFGLQDTVHLLTDFLIKMFSLHFRAWVESNTRRLDAMVRLWSLVPEIIMSSPTLRLFPLLEIWVVFRL